MTRPDLDDLVRLARSDRPSSTTLSAIARRLQIPFVVAPLTVAMLPGSAFAAAAAKLGVSPAWLLAWGAGSAAVVTGGALALTLATSRPTPVEAPRAVEPTSAIRAPKVAQPDPSSVPAIEPEARPLPSSLERPKPREASTSWDEPQLIERARKALGSDPKRALSLTQEYQRRFPGGALSVEREVIALEALARMGQVAEARRRALAFEAAHPSSIHLPRVRALLAKLESR